MTPAKVYASELPVYRSRAVNCSDTKAACGPYINEWNSSPITTPASTVANDDAIAKNTTRPHSLHRPRRSHRQHDAHTGRKANRTRGSARPGTQSRSVRRSRPRRDSSPAPWSRTSARTPRTSRTARPVRRAPAWPRSTARVCVRSTSVTGAVGRSPRASSSRNTGVSSSFVLISSPKATSTADNRNATRQPQLRNASSDSCSGENSEYAVRHQRAERRPDLSR